MHRRAKGALRAGLVTLLAGLLSTATFALPELATHSDFGHHHTGGTAEHLHPLNLLLGGGLPTFSTTAEPLADAAAPRLTPTTHLYHATPSSGFRSRAPPGL